MVMACTRTALDIYIRDETPNNERKYTRLIEDFSRVISIKGSLKISAMAWQ